MVVSLFLCILWASLGVLAVFVSHDEIYDVFQRHYLPVLKLYDELHAQVIKFVVLYFLLSDKIELRLK